MEKNIFLIFLTFSFLLGMKTEKTEEPEEIPTIDLSEKQFGNPWKHFLTYKSLDLLSYWAIHELRHKSIDQDDESKDKKNNVLDKIKDILETKIRLFGVDRTTSYLCGPLPPEEESPFVSLLDEMIPSNNTYGYQQLQVIYTVLFYQHLVSLNIQEGSLNMIMNIISQLALNQFNAYLEPYKEEMNETLRNKGISERYLCPINYTLNLIIEEVLTQGCVTPTTNLIKTQLGKINQKKLLKEAAKNCQCYECLNEIIKDLPDDNPYKQILKTAYTELKINGYLCQHHLFSN